MKPIGYVIALALLALFALAASNWSAFAAPVALSLLFVDFEAPLGLLLLGATAGIALLFFVYAASLRMSMLFESRRLVRDLEEQRRLADEAEASRFTELRAALEQNLAAQLERSEALEAALRTALEVATNTLSAHVGQVDDKLERALGGAPGENQAAPSEEGA